MNKNDEVVELAIQIVIAYYEKTNNEDALRWLESSIKNHDNNYLLWNLDNIRNIVEQAETILMDKKSRKRR